MRREITFCRKVGIPIAGIVENMSGFTCPHCKVTDNIQVRMLIILTDFDSSFKDCTYLFTRNGGKILSEKTNCTFLGNNLNIIWLAFLINYILTFKVRFRSTLISLNASKTERTF